MRSVDKDDEEEGRCGAHRKGVVGTRTGQRWARITATALAPGTARTNVYGELTDSKRVLHNVCAASMSIEVYKSAGSMKQWKK